jgi:hypothetical protein
LAGARRATSSEILSIFRIPSEEMNCANFDGGYLLWNQLENFGNEVKSLTETAAS